MKILNTFAALLAVATVLGAQDAPVRVTLEVDAPVVSVGKPIELTLTARVAAATEVPATLLGGIHLTTYVDGEPSIEIGEPLAGQVPVAAGTEIRRRIPVDPAALWPQGSLIGKSSIVFAWSGLDEARVSLRLVPDHRHRPDGQVARLDHPVEVDQRHALLHRAPQADVVAVARVLPAAPCGVRMYA